MSKSVDSNIETETGGWEFNHEVAQEFDDHVRRSMPNYEQIQQQVTKLVGWHINTERRDHVYDLGCATGETMSHLVKEYEGTNTKLVGIDVERSMLDKAEERLNGHPMVELLRADLTQMERYEAATAVVSLFTLSFLSEPDREKVIRRIYDSLPQGGALIFVEKTRAKSGHIQPMFDEHYWDFKREQGLTDSEILAKAGSLRGQLRPITVDEYYEMLTEAGFLRWNIELFYKWNPWAGFIARK